MSPKVNLIDVLVLVLGSKAPPIVQEKVVALAKEGIHVDAYTGGLVDSKSFN